MPCKNVWIRYRDVEKNKYFYSRAECLALFEDEEGATGVQYIDMDTYGVYELNDCNQDGIVHSESDLSQYFDFVGKHGN